MNEKQRHLLLTDFSSKPHKNPKIAFLAPQLFRVVPIMLALGATTWVLLFP